MKLGFVSARGTHCDQDGMWFDAGVGRLIDCLRARSEQFTCALAHHPARRPEFDHMSPIPEADLVKLPVLPGFARGFHKFPDCRRAIREVESRSDVVIVQLPFIAPFGLLGARKPRVYHAFGDVLNMARVSSAYSGLSRGVAMSMAHLVDGMQRSFCRRPDAALVSNGKEIFDRYVPGRGRVVVSSTFLASEIGSVQRSRPQAAPFRILFVGYLRPEKGVDTLLAAYRLLLDQIPDAELHIVGPDVAEKRNANLNIVAAFDALRGRGNVKFLGHKAFGPALFECYANADVLVLPSRSEGTPRVLVEARAFGCPVVASNVGGIPSSVEDGVDGILIEPDDAPALAAAIERTARDAALKGKLIEEGFTRARNTSVESFANALFQEAEGLVA